MGSNDLLANITCLVYSYDGTGMPPSIANIFSLECFVQNLTHKFIFMANDKQVNNK